MGLSTGKFFEMVVPSLLISNINNWLGWRKTQGKAGLNHYLYDNARPHIAKSIWEKLLKLEWITVPHPPCSSHLALMDYYLFHSLSHYLREEKFNKENDMKTEIANFFSSKV